MAQATTAEQLRNRITPHADMTEYWQVSLVSKMQVKRRVIGFLPGKLGKKTQHVALLDMDLPVSNENLTTIRERASEMLVPQYGHFFIAESGRSYHLIGTKPMSVRRLRKVYGQSLLMDVNKHISPDGTRKRLVDTMYIGHCLAERNGTGNLRLTGNKAKPIPRIVGYI